MNLRTLTWLIPVGLLLSTSLTHAQPTSGAVTTAPDKTASGKTLFQYRSIFTHYQLFNDQPVTPWRDANETAGKIGGWRFYAKDASQPDTVDTSPEPESNPQMRPPVNNDSHSGHGSKP